MEGAVERVRPKMMTVVAIMAGLLPIMWGTGTGSEVMSRIAAPMVGGMISSTVLTLGGDPGALCAGQAMAAQEGSAFCPGFSHTGSLGLFSGRVRMVS
jgi:Cu/Ag efflux pump CusA